MMQVVRKKLSASEVSPSNLRYNEDCNCIQQTVDGTNWVDNPGVDPRSADPFRLPPRGGADPRCDAAANMTAFLRASIDSFLTATSVAQAVSTLLDLWLLALPGVGILVDLLIILAEGLFSIGTAAIAVTFTNAVYEQLFCIFYCNISDDGTVTSAQLSAIFDAVHALGDGVLDGVMDYILNTWGAVGLSNAGAGGAEVGDCSACGCAWCYTFDFTIEDGLFAVITGSNGLWVSGSGWQSVNPGGVSYQILGIHKGFPARVITNVDVYYDAISTPAGQTGVGLPEGTEILNSSAGGAGLHLSWSGSVTAGSIAVYGSYTASGRVTQVTLRGLGGNPFGVDNC